MNLREAVKRLSQLFPGQSYHIEAGVWISGQGDAAIRSRWKFFHREAKYSLEETDLDRLVAAASLWQGSIAYQRWWNESQIERKRMDALGLAALDALDASLEIEAEVFDANC